MSLGDIKSHNTVATKNTLGRLVSGVWNTFISLFKKPNDGDKFPINNKPSAKIPTVDFSRRPDSSHFTSVGFAKDRATRTDQWNRLTPDEQKKRIGSLNTGVSSMKEDLAKVGNKIVFNEPIRIYKNS